MSIKSRLPPPSPRKSVNFEDFLLICTVFPHFGPFLRRGGGGKPNFADKNFMDTQTFLNNFQTLENCRFLTPPIYTPTECRPTIYHHCPRSASKIYGRCPHPGKHRHVNHSGRKAAKGIAHCEPSCLQGVMGPIGIPILFLQYILTHVAQCVVLMLLPCLHLS